MDRMTQQNAAMVEQATAAARSLASEAHELTALVDRFRMGESEDRPPIARRRDPACNPVDTQGARQSCSRFRTGGRCRRPGGRLVRILSRASPQRTPFHHADISASPAAIARL
jgi:hypothetical protein